MLQLLQRLLRMEQVPALTPRTSLLGTRYNAHKEVGATGDDAKRATAGPGSEERRRPGYAVHRTDYDMDPPPAEMQQL